MTDTVRIVDPSGHLHVVEASLAGRPTSIAGLRPGILQNRKANALLLMESMVEGLRARVPLGSLIVASKPVAGPPSDEAVSLLRNGSDFVLVGSSD